MPFERRGTKRARKFLAMESVNSLRISAPQWWPLREGRDGKCEGRNEKCEFLARESVNSSPILARQWWRHFRLSLSVSLSLSHRKYLTHNIGSASALPIIIGSAEALPILCVRCARWERERERERYRERRKWRHQCPAKIGDEFTLPLPKIRTWRWVYTFPYPGHHCGAEIRNKFSLPLPKNSALFVPNLSIASGAVVLPIEKNESN